MKIAPTNQLAPVAAPLQFSLSELLSSDGKDKQQLQQQAQLYTKQASNAER